MRLRLAVCLLGCVVFFSTGAIVSASTTSPPVTTRVYSVAHGGCPPGQICPTRPVALGSFVSDSSVNVVYTAAGSHCSDVAVRLFVDGSLAATTPFVTPSQSSAATAVPWPADGAPHTLGYEGEGKSGGCNMGHLESWAGTLTVTYTPVVCSVAGGSVAGRTAAQSYCTETTIDCTRFQARIGPNGPPAFDKCTATVLALGTRQAPTGKVKVSFAPAAVANVYPSQLSVSTRPQCALAAAGFVSSSNEAKAVCSFYIAPNERFAGGRLTVHGDYVPSSATFKTSSAVFAVTWPHLALHPHAVTITLRFHQARPLEVIMRSGATLRICDGLRNRADPSIYVPHPQMWAYAPHTYYSLEIYPRAAPGQPHCTPPIRLRAPGGNRPTLVDYDSGYTNHTYTSVAVIVP